MSAEYCRKTGKVKHKSEGAAAAQLRSLHKLNGYAGHTYPCTYCCGWHVGRYRSKAHKNKYKSS